MADIEVKIGDIAATKNADNLVASGIGSCVVVTLYDPRQNVGALAHAMLPTRLSSPAGRQPDRRPRDTRYVDIAIGEMLKRMETLGAKRQDMEAKIVGGANMFTVFKSDIGKENVLSAKETLRKEGIKLIGESVGGNIGRSVELSAKSGIVTVKIKF